MASSETAARGFHNWWGGVAGGVRPATLASSGACNRSRGLFSWGVSTPEFPTAEPSVGAKGRLSFLASDFSNCSSRLDKSDASIPISLMKACTTSSGPCVRGVGRKDSFLSRAGWTVGSLGTVLCLCTETALTAGQRGFSLGLISWVSGFSASDAGSSTDLSSTDRLGGALGQGLCATEDTLCFSWGETGTDLTSTLATSICGPLSVELSAGPRLQEGAIGTGAIGTFSGEPAKMELGSTVGGRTSTPIETGTKGGGGTAGQNGGCCGLQPHPMGP